MVVQLAYSTYANIDISIIDDSSLVYIYDGSLEGMFSAIFTAFERKELPVNITTDNDLQQSMLCSYIPVELNLQNAERVRDGIIKTLGQVNYENIKKVFLSDNPCKGRVLLNYLQYTMRKNKWSCTHFSNPAVAAFEELLRQVSTEAHYMMQFVRFAQLSNGIYFSRIEPKASVTPLIMDHFADRFNIQPFVIYDHAHSVAGVYDLNSWWMVTTREFDLPCKTNAEDDFQLLWQTFYDTIAIEERKNPTCQRNFMPKRFWGNMCEHIPPQLRNKRLVKSDSFTSKKSLTCC